MAFRWNRDGPGFEFPTPYRTENRILQLRGVLLLLLALLVWALAWHAGATGVPLDSPLLADRPEPGSGWPHALSGAWLAVLGALELLRAARQSRLLIAAGHPGSLVVQVRRETTGASPGAPRLLLAMSSGQVDGASPPALERWLRWRRALLAGAAVLAAVVLLAWLLVRPGPVRDLAALWCAVLGGALVTRWLLAPDAEAPRPWLHAALAVLALAGLGAALAASRVPRAEAWPVLGLVPGVLLLLGSSLVFDLLGMLAGRARIEQPQPGSSVTETQPIDATVDPATLMREVEQELHRGWAEGVPNRRYVWQTPGDAPGAAVEMLEESQPLHTQPSSEGASPWLLTLGAASVLWTLAGGVLLARLARQQLLDGSAPWTQGAVGVALVLAGGYALRVAHLLWSRVEVASTLVGLRVEGELLPGGRYAATRLQACVVRANSVFYAAASQGVGSRVLLHLAGDAAATRAWLQQLATMARARPVSAVAARTTAPDDGAARAAPVARNNAPRFCPACGTPVLAGARYCGHCGQSLLA